MRLGASEGPRGVCFRDSGSSSREDPALSLQGVPLLSSLGADGVFLGVAHGVYQQLGICGFF